MEAVRGTDLALRLGHSAALAGVSITLAPGEVAAVVGPSGCGKSTLLYVLSGILRPDEGEVWLAGRNLDDLRDAGRSRLRLRHTGFVFQFGDLVPELTIAENVGLPLRMARVRPQRMRERVMADLERLGIAELRDRRPAQVSGGQLQRAAIARAMIHRPEVVFADEPTGALDSAAADVVLDALLQMARDVGTTLLIVSHDPRVAAAVGRVIRMRDGAIDTSQSVDADRYA